MNKRLIIIISIGFVVFFVMILLFSFGGGGSKSETSGASATTQSISIPTEEKLKELAVDFIYVFETYDYESIPTTLTLYDFMSPGMQQFAKQRESELYTQVKEGDSQEVEIVTASTTVRQLGANEVEVSGPAVLKIVKGNQDIQNTMEYLITLRKMNEKWLIAAIERYPKN